MLIAPRFCGAVRRAFRIVIIPAKSLALSFASASIRRASMPDQTGVGSVRAHSVVKMKLVLLSKPRPAGEVPSVVPVTGMRGSFADANGMAFLMMPVTSKLSPTVHRLALVFNDQI